MYLQLSLITYLQQNIYSKKLPKNVKDPNAFKLWLSSESSSGKMENLMFLV